MQRYTVGEAARLLDVGTDAIRKRNQRGTIETVFEDGTRYVLLDESETRHAAGADTGTDTGRDTDLIAELRAHNETLRTQLEAERQAHAEARRLLAAALERIPPQLEAPQEPPGAPETASGPPDRGDVPPATGGAREGSERPWWRRVFGGG